MNNNENGSNRSRSLLCQFGYTEVDDGKIHLHNRRNRDALVRLYSRPTHARNTQFLHRIRDESRNVCETVPNGISALRSLHIWSTRFETVRNFRRRLCHYVIHQHLRIFE